MMQTRAVKFYNYGGPEVLRFEEKILPNPLEDEVRILHKAIGVNFVDTYYRTGLYQSSLPSGEAVGKNVTHLKMGDRVAYVQGPLGAYSERRNISANLVIKIPDNVSFGSLTLSYLRTIKVLHDEVVMHLK